jgi:hypothetical protein
MAVGSAADEQEALGFSGERLRREQQQRETDSSDRAHVRKTRASKKKAAGNLVIAGSHYRLDLRATLATA